MNERLISHPGIFGGTPVTQEFIDGFVRALDEDMVRKAEEANEEYLKALESTRVTAADLEVAYR